MKDLNLFKAKDSVWLKEVLRKEDLVGLEECDTHSGYENLRVGGVLIRGDEKISRSIIASLKDRKFSGKVGVYGGDDSFNRRVVETLRIDYLVSPEKDVGRDTLKQRDSGLNHVVAREMKKKGVSVVVDFGEVAGLEGKEKAVRIARIMQNVLVCRRAGVKVLIGSLGEKKDEVFDEKGRRAFGETLGMSSQEIKLAVSF